MQELVRHTISVYFKVDVDVTGISTVSFTGSFLQALRSLQQPSLPIQPFFLSQMLSDVFHTNR
jgi:hypothetical protein